MQGWTGEEALQEMHAFHFNKVWVGNPGFVKRMDVEGLRAKVQAAPAPVLLRVE